MVFCLGTSFEDDDDDDDQKLYFLKQTGTNLYFSPPKVLDTEVVMREVQEPTTPREQLELHAAGVTVRL